MPKVFKGRYFPAILFSLLEYAGTEVIDHILGNAVFVSIGVESAGQSLAERFKELTSDWMDISVGLVGFVSLVAFMQKKTSLCQAYLLGCAFLFSGVSIYCAIALNLVLIQYLGSGVFPNLVKAPFSTVLSIQGYLLLSAVLVVFFYIFSFLPLDEGCQS